MHFGVAIQPEAFSSIEAKSPACYEAEALLKDIMVTGTWVTDKKRQVLRDALKNAGNSDKRIHSLLEDISKDPKRFCSKCNLKDGTMNLLRELAKHGPTDAVFLAKDAPALTGLDCESIRLSSYTSSDLKRDVDDDKLNPTLFGHREPGEARNYLGRELRYAKELKIYDPFGNKCSDNVKQGLKFICECWQRSASTKQEKWKVTITAKCPEDRSYKSTRKECEQLRVDATKWKHPAELRWIFVRPGGIHAFHGRFIQGGGKVWQIDPGIDGFAALSRGKKSGQKFNGPGADHAQSCREYDQLEVVETIPGTSSPRS